jgi:hypothetical protein
MLLVNINILHKMTLVNLFADSKSQGKCKRGGGG